MLLEGKPQEVLTSDLLTDKGFGISRYTSVARKAKELGMWKKDKLPVTLDEAVEGFALTLPSTLTGTRPEGRGEE